MPMSDPVDSTGPLMKGDDERTPGKLVTLRDVGHTFTGDTWLFRSLNADLRPDRVYVLVGLPVRAKAHCCPYWRDG